MPTYGDFDLDGNGMIDEQEFYQARGKRVAEMAEQGRKLKNLAQAPSFTDIDTDGDGNMSGKEFTAHQKNHCQHRQQQQ